jgi:CDP-diacylglycerol---glycerol-3-phosphate 3-phosphatidyltransferase
MTLSNKITSIRISLCPIFLILFLMDGVRYKILAFIVVIISEITDAMDGYLARKRNQLTMLGKLLDPYADSLFRYTTFLCFTGYIHNGHNLIPIWMVVLIFYRDASIWLLRTISASQNFILSARISGKIKAIIQAVSILIIMLLIILTEFGSNVYLYPISYVLMLLVTIFTLSSGVEYITANWDFLKNIKK